MQLARSTKGMAGVNAGDIIKPVIITDTVRYDTDDPAIWINEANPAASLVLGTDKDRMGLCMYLTCKGRSCLVK